MVPAALVAGRREDLVERRPQAQRAVAAGQQRRRQPAIPQAQHARPGGAALAVAELHGEELLAAVLARPDHDQQAAVLGLQPRAEVDAV